MDGQERAPKLDQNESRGGPVRGRPALPPGLSLLLALAGLLIVAGLGMIAYRSSAARRQVVGERTDTLETLIEAYAQSGEIGECEKRLAGWDERELRELLITLELRARAPQALSRVIAFREALDLEGPEISQIAILREVLLSWTSLLGLVLFLAGGIIGALPETWDGDGAEMSRVQQRQAAEAPARGRTPSRGNGELEGEKAAAPAEGSERGAQDAASSESPPPAEGDEPERGKTAALAKGSEGGGQGVASSESPPPAEGDEQGRAKAAAPVEGTEGGKPKEGKADGDQGAEAPEADGASSEKDAIAEILTDVFATEDEEILDLEVLSEGLEDLDIRSLRQDLQTLLEHLRRERSGGDEQTDRK